MEIQPEVKVKSREREGKRRRERERHGGSQSPKKPGRETSSRNWSEKLAPRSWPPEAGPSPLLFRRPFILLIKHGDQWVTQNYVVFAAQTLSVHHVVYKRSQVIYIIFWPRGLLTLFWLSSLMNVNFVSPKVFFFNLHLLNALKLRLYRTKVQWDITLQGKRN